MFLKPMFNLFKSSSFRFALLTGFTIWLTTSLVLVIVYLKLEDTIWNNIDRNLDQQTENLLARAASNPDVDVSELVAAFNAMSRTTTTTFQHNGIDMIAMHNSPAMDALHSVMGIANPPDSMMGESQRITGNEGNLQFTREVTLPSGEIISISHNIEYLNDLQNSLWQSLIFGLSFTLLIAFLGALLLTQRSLRRIHQINQACRTIMAGDFSHRVPYANATSRFDDYDQMALHINRMLDEINALVVKVRQVSDNIAHDLKSPLARLRAQLETAYEQSPSIELESGLSEVDRLLGMIKSLLGIARIESRAREPFDNIDLQSLLGDIQEMYLPVFEDKQIKFLFDSEPGVMKADKHLLIQALANLLDNAYKFTPAGGTVKLMSKTNEQDISIEIHDTGPGIEEESLVKVFERFHREDSARNTTGFGLGLSLVEAIVTLHGGSVSLKNENGLVVKLVFPQV
jgi:signal transduction histidine kinase